MAVVAAFVAEALVADVAIETVASAVATSFFEEELAGAALGAIAGEVAGAGAVTASLAESVLPAAEAATEVAAATAAAPEAVLTEMSQGLVPPPEPMSLEEAISVAEQGAEASVVPEVTAEELVPSLTPSQVASAPIDIPGPLESAFPETTTGLPEAPATPQAPALPESPLQQNILPGESGGIPTGKLKPGLAYLADALGAPAEMVEALQNPVVNNIVTSAMRSGLTGKSLEDTIQNALISGAGAATGMVTTDLTDSKLAGRLASYATTSALKGQTPSVEGFLGTAAAQGALSTLSNELPDWAKPAAESATNYLSGQVGQALTGSPTAPQRQAASPISVRPTAGTPTGLPTAATSTLGTPTGGGLPVGMVQKVAPTDQSAAPQFGQILGEESGLTNTPIRYGNPFARPMLAPNLLSSTMPTDQQVSPLFSGLTDEQASLVSGGLTDQNTAIDPALQRLILARGYAIGGAVDLVPGPENRLYRRHMKRGFAVNGPGTGQSDDIPTMLADGEYVIDADTVAQLGDGSSKAGAQILDKFREEIRQHKRSAPVNKIPPAAKSPLEYLKMARKKHG
jgi:hypothetical protein